MTEYLTTPFSYLTIFGAYLLGSIPFGLLFTKWGGGGDIRTQGSGNIGATNVLRTGNKILAFLTLLFDFLKGYFAIKIALLYHVEYLAAVAVVMGHMFPVWLKFKGGKGVATYFGVLCALSLPLGAQALLAWLTFSFLFGYSSLAAILTIILVPFTAWIWGYGDPLFLTTLGISTIVLIKHSSNIVRLFQGQEPKINSKKKVE